MANPAPFLALGLDDTRLIAEPEWDIAGFFMVHTGPKYHLVRLVNPVGGRNMTESVTESFCHPRMLVMVMLGC